MIAIQKLWNMFFISSKKAFFVLEIFRYLYFYLLPVSHCFRAWSRINLKVYDVINCLNENLITHFVWYLEKKKRYDIKTLFINRVLNKEHFYGKIMQKNVLQKLVPDSFFILVNNWKQLMHARNSFKNKIL